MNILYYIFNKIDKEVVVVNSANIIVWINEYATREFDIANIIGKNFDKIFKLDYDEALCKNVLVIADAYTKDVYTFDKKECTIEESVYCIYFMENETSFENSKVKLYCYESIIENLDSGVLLSDINGRIVIFNKASTLDKNINKEDIINKKLEDIYVYNTDASREHEYVLKVGKPLINQYNKVIYRGREGNIYGAYSTYPIRRKGKTIAVFSVSRDEKRIHNLLAELIELKRKIRIFDSQEKDEKLSNGTVYSFSGILGESEKMLGTISEAKDMALIQRNILIIGETGTGKEVFAQSIHNYSKKSHEPFVPVNCAAIPENLLESILFGTVKGSYTGALDTEGLFKIAGNGTLFLDELNSMPMPMQTKLLRVLQERKAMRVGETKLYDVGCRIISAVNEDPHKLIDEGKLRSDLFFRIAPLILYIYPLRERKDDIIGLTYYYIRKYSELLEKNITGINDELKNMLLEYSWPGNVRELDFIIENLIIKCKNKNMLTIDDMPLYWKSNFEHGLGDIDDSIVNDKGLDLNKTLEAVEKRMIEKMLEYNNWNLTKTAKSLNIFRQNLSYRIKKLKIRRVK